MTTGRGYFSRSDWLVLEMGLAGGPSCGKFKKRYFT